MKPADVVLAAALLKSQRGIVKLRTLAAKATRPCLAVSDENSGDVEDVEMDRDIVMSAISAAQAEIEVRLAAIGVEAEQANLSSTARGEVE